MRWARAAAPALLAILLALAAATPSGAQPRLHVKQAAFPSMDVASVVSGYSMQTGVSVNGTLSSERAIQGNYAAIGGQAVYTDRPTITYVPTTGDKFLRGLITPLDPKNVFFLLQSGYAADFILGLAVESLNGVRNRSADRRSCARVTAMLPSCSRWLAKASW